MNTNCKKCCTAHMTAKVLVAIGGINWGLIGLGMLLGNMNWNVIHLIFSFSFVVEGIIYLLVGISAVMMIFGCKCKKCMGTMDTMSPMGDKKEEAKMQ